MFNGPQEGRKKVSKNKQKRDYKENREIKQNSS